MIKKWKFLDSRMILETPIYSLEEKDFEHPINKSVFHAKILHPPDWANIIALTPNNEILLIRQFRFGTNKIEMEIPGGCIESGEKPLQAAKRELEEETGYQSKSWKQIGVVDANPAIQSNKCYTFLAKNVKPVGKINFDPEEIIESKIVPLSSAYEYVRKGKITNTYIVAAFLWLAAEQGKI